MAAKSAPPVADTDKSASHVSPAARITSLPRITSCTPTTAESSSVTRRHTRSLPHDNLVFHALPYNPPKQRRRDPSRPESLEIGGHGQTVNREPVTSPIQRRTSSRLRNMDASDSGQPHRQQQSTASPPIDAGAPTTPSLRTNVMEPSPWRMDNPFAFSAGHMQYPQLYAHPARAAIHMSATRPFIHGLHHQQPLLHQHHQTHLELPHPQQQPQQQLQSLGVQAHHHHYQPQAVRQPFDFRTDQIEDIPLRPLLPALDINGIDIRQGIPPPRGLVVAPFESIAERRKTTSRTASRVDSESASNASDGRKRSGLQRRTSEPVGAQSKSKPKPKQHANQWTPSNQLSQDPSAVALSTARATQQASKGSKTARPPQAQQGDQDQQDSRTLTETIPSPSPPMASSSLKSTKMTPARAKNRAISRIFNQLQRGTTDEEDRKDNAKEHWQEAKRLYEAEKADSDVIDEDVKAEDLADTIEVHTSSFSANQEAHANGGDDALPLEEQEYVPDQEPTKQSSNHRSPDVSAKIEAAALRGIKVTPASIKDIEQYTTPDENLDWTNEPNGKKRAQMQSVISSRKYLAKQKAQKANKTAATQGLANLRNGLNAGTGTPRPAKRLRRRMQDDVTTASPEVEKEEEGEADAVKIGEQPIEETDVAQLSQQEALGMSDAEFIEQMKDVLAARSERGKPRDFGFKQAGRILNLLNSGELVTESSEDALFTTPEGAAEWCQAGKFFGGPIFVSGAQPLPLQTVDQFFDEHYDDSIYVYVQDPAIKLAANVAPVRRVKLAEVKKRFAKGTTNKPWNCLELATHVEDGLRPNFLNTEDCRLLTKVKFPTKEDEASRNGYHPGWKEVEKWALVAQGGALTEPHQDSHGYSTYITVNQGLFGYGWLAKPTAEERAAWKRSNTQYVGGRWRYTICRPGQTVYFPAGTVHFVFRLPAAGPTLAFGGHVLRCSQIVHWVKTLIAEQAAPEITNEDLTVSAPAYLNRVHKFVLQALKGDPRQADKWGGTKSIAEFMELKTKYEEAVERRMEELGLNGRKGRSRKHRAASDE
ncbi:hypothetical protein Tdes44962_MAKER04713 [Teratosphaeria destructans]|uniref:JmjC domain-containing protein n=1 Tax=Teratosphaeria destructans TaxID=418781 RepID=A0A9W7VZJ5_9PEZI|nr:hypothetical protein Tdes44962_MAKER04713 [Teratosphaeria destructans]